MDPLSSLEVAGDVIQFVDFGIKLVSRFKEIYRSADGALQEKDDLSEVRPYSPVTVPTRSQWPVWIYFALMLWVVKAIVRTKM